MSLVVALLVYLALVAVMPAIWAVSIALLLFIGLSGITKQPLS